jgi:hypothetical protein
MSLSPATDQDAVTVAVPAHNRADIADKTIESKLQRQLDAASSGAAK